jgi:hypothetical protein
VSSAEDAKGWGGGTRNPLKIFAFEEEIASVGEGVESGAGEDGSDVRLPLYALCRLLHLGQPHQPRRSLAVLHTEAKYTP